MHRHIVTIDSGYRGHSGLAAAYLMVAGDEAAFVENNTTKAVPRLLAALSETGLRPEQVRYVIITHVHLDHAGGSAVLMEACPQALLLAHPRAAKHIIDPERLVASAKQVYGAEEFSRMYGEIQPVVADRVRALEDGEQAEFGGGQLRFPHVRGHANHHFCVVAPEHSAVFTGDAFGLCYPDLQEGGRFAAPSTTPTDFDAQLAKQSVDLIAALDVETAYLTHFGGYHDREVIAGQLREQLDGYGAIVDDGLASDLAETALLDFCRARVAALLAPWLTTPRRQQAAKPGGVLAMDIDINAQGVAVAVERARRRAAAP